MSSFLVTFSKKTIHSYSCPNTAIHITKLTLVLQLLQQPNGVCNSLYFDRPINATWSYTFQKEDMQVPVQVNKTTSLPLTLKALSNWMSAFLVTYGKKEFIDTPIPNPSLFITWLKVAHQLLQAGFRFESLVLSDPSNHIDLHSPKWKNTGEQMKVRSLTLHLYPVLSCPNAVRNSSLISPKYSHMYYRADIGKYTNCFSSINMCAHQCHMK